MIQTRSRMNLVQLWALLAGNRHVNNSTNDKALSGQVVSFAAEDSTKVWDLDAVSMGVFNKALENIAFLRAQSGGSMSRFELCCRFHRCLYRKYACRSRSD